MKTVSTIFHMADAGGGNGAADGGTSPTAGKTDNTPAGDSLGSPAQGANVDDLRRTLREGGTFTPPADDDDSESEHLSSEDFYAGADGAESREHQDDAEGGEQESEESDEGEHAEGESEGEDGEEGGEAGEEEGEQQDQDQDQDQNAGQKPTSRRRVNINRKREDGSFVYDERERAIMGLSLEEGISLTEAEERLFGPRDSGGKPTQEQQHQEAIEQTANAITAKEREIADLERESKAAEDSFDFEKVTSIGKKLRTADRELADLNRQREQQENQQRQEKARTVGDAINASKSDAVRLFPDSRVKGSTLNKAMSAEITRLQSENPKFFEDSDWPLTLASKCAAKLGIAPATVKTTAKAKPIQAQQAQKRSQPVRSPSPTSGSSSAQRTGGGKTQLSPDDVSQLIKNERDPVKLKGFLRNNGTH